MRNPIIGLVVLGLAACNPALAPNGMPPKMDPYNLKTPSLLAGAPSLLAVGDTVQLIGSDFIDPAHGKLRIHFRGEWTNQATGVPSRYEADIPLTYQNSGLATFPFAPNVIFSPSGFEIGILKADAVITSRVNDPDGREAASVPLHLEFNVGPSVIVTNLHSVDGRCSGVTSSTISSHNLALGFRAIGLQDGIDVAPMTFRVHIASPGVQVAYVTDQTYAAWPISKTATTVVTAPDGDSYFEADVINGSELYLDPQSIAQSVRVSPPINIGQTQTSNAKLFNLLAGAVNGLGAQNTNFFVEAVDSTGATAHRLVPLKVYNPAEALPFNGSTKIVERYAAQEVSACFPGGDIGRDLTYTEGTSETRSRSLTFQWSNNIGNSASVTAGVSFLMFFTASATGSSQWSQTFGVDVSQSVSSETHKGFNLTAHVLPTYFGACYRQTERIELATDLIIHDPCGASIPAGRAVVTDWNWGFDIATGPNCPPPTSLPPAQAF